MFLYILVGILVIAAAVIVGIYAYQKQALNTVNAILEQKEALLAADFTDQLANEKRASLSGDSLKDFDQLQTKYQEEFLTAATRVDELAEQVKKELRGMSFLQVKPSLRKLKEAVAKLQSEKNDLVNGLNKIEDTKAQHQTAIENLTKQYQGFRKELDENGYRYGKSGAALKDQLLRLEDHFKDFKLISAQGDYEAAQERLQELLDDTKAFEKNIQRVPGIYKPLFTEYPTQLEELQTGYDQLTQQHYNFTDDDIAETIQRLTSTCDQAVQDLYDLKLDEAQSASDQLAEQIERLYDIMQREIDAKPKVTAIMRDNGRHLEHAKQQNRELIAELDRLSLNYTLNNDELADARSLGEQLRQVQASFDEDQKAIAAQEAIASQVLARQTENEATLTAIEEQQKAINDGVADLQTDEARAKKTLQKFAVEIRTVKRRVESLNLPGIPKDYMDYFFLVSDEIAKLADAINQVKINMDEITKQLLIVQGDLETLTEKTDDLRDSAELTERLIQYANRLSIKHESINEAIDAAQVKFEHYDYPGSLEILAKAIEKVEPGAYKRLEQHYYSEIK